MADWLIPSIRLGLTESIVVGILGAFVGGWLFGVLGISVGTDLGGTIIVDIVGVVVPLLLVAAIRRSM